MMLFALDTDRSLGESIAKRLSTELARHEERNFEDGEHKARPLVSVRGEDVFVVGSLYGDDRQGVNDKLVRLLFFLGAVRDAGAERITAVIPYVCYARKDRKTKSRDPITTRYVAQLFETMGVRCVVVLEVHNLAAFQNAFRIPTVHLEAAPLFMRHFLDTAPDENMTIVAPDAGGVKRADRLRGMLAEQLRQEIPLAIMEKHRSQGVVSGDLFAGAVEGRRAIVVDDLISTGTTLARAASACRTRGARRVQAAATHALLTGDAQKILADEALEKIIISNSVRPFRLEGTDTYAKLQLLDVAPLLAETIRRLHADEPVEDVDVLTAPQQSANAVDHKGRLSQRAH